MMTSKEFFERIANDEAFAKEVSEAVKAKREAGAANYYETIIPAAAEYGYEISREELDEIYEKETENMSEEELGKVAGGTSCWFLFVVSSLIGSFTVLTKTLD